jgi:hypothetical protein
MLEREQALAQKRGLELALARERGLERGLARELERELALARGLALERAMGLERAQEWAHGLGQIPLVLGPMKNFALATTVPSRHVHFMISLLYGLIYSNIA